MAEAQPAEVVFAQQLASNESSVRNRSLKKLQKFISARSATDTGGVIQNDLQTAPQLPLHLQPVPVLPDVPPDDEERMERHRPAANGQVLPARPLHVQRSVPDPEETGMGVQVRSPPPPRFIDPRLQMNRRSTNLSSDPPLTETASDSVCSVLKQFLQLISDQLLLSSCAAPAGLLLHVLDLYMTELALVGAAELTADQNLVFIEPFCRTMARTKDRQLLQAIGKSLLSTIVDQVPFAIEDLLREIKQSEGVEDEEQETVEPLEKSASEDEEERDGAEDGEEHQAVLQFDYGALADRLFNAASHSYIHSFNRSKIYKFVKIFRDLAEGVFPQDEVEDVSTDEDDCDDPSRKRNTKKLAKRKDSEKREPSSDADTKPKKKRKKNEEKETQRGASEEERLSPELSIDDDVVEAEACPEASVEDSPVTPSQKKKKRRKKKKRKAAEAKPLDENKRKPNERNGDDPLPTETNEKREADKPETKGEDSPQWSEEIPESQKNEDPSKLNHSPDPTENNKGKGSPESLEAEDVIEAEGVSVEDSPVTPSQKKNAVETQFSEEKKSQANCDEAEEKPELKREDEDSEADANRLRLKKTNAEVQSQTEAPSEITSENPDVLRGDDQSHPMPNGDGTTEGAVMEKDLASDRNPETRAAGHIVILRAKRRKQKGARLNRSEERTKKVRVSPPAETSHCSMEWNSRRAGEIREQLLRPTPLESSLRSPAASGSFVLRSAPPHVRMLFSELSLLKLQRRNSHERRSFCVKLRGWV
ncbi:hypothetical protein DNTS_003338 [Danionella cerebrum]|uniref:Uncharacterized protein n=1 Tax=Danionella cerebrum TaxID=2873325 RepID=A0A553QNY3_9TELE|nr:hypothetical protein DNTS_003338 [Danionella translucida]